MNPRCRIGRVKPHAGGDVRLLPSANIECMPGLLTRLDIPSERVLLAAITAGIAPVVVAGRDQDGKLYLASSCATGEVITLLARAQALAVRVVDEEPHQAPPRPAG